MCDKNNLTLIEDSAQAVPNDSFSSYWNGDFIILSFGRGKPLNLLGGGAVLTKPETHYNDNLHALDIKKPSNKKSILYNLKIIIYNILIQPFFYSILFKLPGLHIGSTIYKPLLEINALHEHTLNKITSNFNHYVNENRSGSIIHKHLSTITNDLVIDLAGKYNSVKNLLRYPILIKDPKLQKLVLVKYKDKGLSNMYGKELNQIEGTENFLDATEKYPNAKNFANNLITIPIHSDFHEKDIIEIVDFIKKY
ncbi:hypothetical protein MNBD_GAMMA07-1698 [hydrothermal vent metagenome]|uniref:Uncharacterized protein n=1 Tax=hydrothermal vent metagenome TaxID=652676 RepID=A0A3B0X7W9_9ZZZZ